MTIRKLKEHQRNCVVCGDVFYPTTGHEGSQKYCNSKCGNKIWKKDTHGILSSKGIAGSTVGAIAELEVSCDLMKKGYSVFRSVSPASNFDLVGFLGEKLVTFEVRTGYIYTTGTLGFQRKPTDRADFYAVVVRSPYKILYVRNAGENRTPEDIPSYNGE